MLDLIELENIIRVLLKKYHAEYALLFGSYARGEATEDSDVDLVVFGGSFFKKSNIFALAEDLRQLTGKDVDAFEISEINQGTDFYDSVLREGRRIA